MGTTVVTRRRAKAAEAKRKMTVDEAWRVLMRREPSKVEQLATAWEEASARHKRAVEARERAWKAEQKTWDAQNAAWDAYMAAANARNEELRAEALGDDAPTGAASDE